MQSSWVSVLYIAPSKTSSTIVKTALQKSSISFIKHFLFQNFLTMSKLTLVTDFQVLTIPFNQHFSWNLSALRVAWKSKLSLQVIPMSSQLSFCFVFTFSFINITFIREIRQSFYCANRKAVTTN